MDRKKILVLGIGNLLLQDEGIGVHVVQRMMDMPLPSDVEVMDGGTMGMDLVYSLEGREKVIVIDTVKAGSPPGTLYRFTEKNIVEKAPFLRTAHGINFPEALKIAKLIGKCPEQIVFIGVEPESMDEGMELSQNIGEKVPNIIKIVMRELGL